MSSTNKDELLLQKVMASPCEKAVSGECNYAKKACFFKLQYEPTMNIIPARRWMECYSWKRMLGLSFNKKYGVYLPENYVPRLE